MKIGYLLTDFPMWDENDNLKILKTSSLIIQSSIYGNIIIDSGSPYSEQQFKDGLLNYFNLKPEDINYVILSHSHPDHIGLAYLFNNASIILPEDDYNLSIRLIDQFYKGKSIYDFMMENCGNYKETFSRNDEKNVTKYLQCDWCKPEKISKLKISFIKESPDILKYIKPIDTKGHTFSHYSYQINTKTESILCSGDAVSNRMVLLTDNDILIEPQMDKTNYIKSINKIKEFDGILVCGHDLPFNTKTFKSFKKNIIIDDSNNELMDTSKNPIKF